MRVSILTCVRESHEYLRRQVLYMNRLNIPDWIEWVIVDHCNYPKLEFDVEPNFKAKIVSFQDDSPWIIPSLVNFGRKHCSGEYIFKLDVDHMLSKHWIDKFANTSTAEFAHFPKIYAFLDKNGELGHYEEDSGVMIYKTDGTAGTSWMKMSIFDELEGYDTNFDGIGFGADIDLKRRYILKKLKQAGCIADIHIAIGPYIYMLPEKPNPKRPYHLLHTLLKKGEYAN